MPKKILITEDDTNSSLLFSELVRSYGYDVYCVDNGLDCMRYIYENSGASQKPNLLLLDLNMPGISGHEVLQKLKEYKTGIPVIVISGDVKALDRQKFNDQIYAVLDKPIDTGLFKQKVRGALGEATDQ